MSLHLHRGIKQLKIYSRMMSTNFGTSNKKVDIVMFLILILPLIRILAANSSILDYHMLMFTYE